MTSFLWLCNRAGLLTTVHGLLWWHGDMLIKTLSLSIQGPVITPHPPFIKQNLFCFIPACDWSDFCLEKFSIPNRWEEDKGTQRKWSRNWCVAVAEGETLNKSKSSPFIWLFLLSLQSCKAQLLLNFLDLFSVLFCSFYRLFSKVNIWTLAII